MSAFQRLAADQVTMRTILIVDDDDATLTAFQRALTRDGTDVHTAESGEAALSLLDRVRPDLIISDVRMPSMNGIELLTFIRPRLPQYL